MMNNLDLNHILNKVREGLIYNVQGGPTICLMISSIESKLITTPEPNNYPNKISSLNFRKNTINTSIVTPSDYIKTIIKLIITNLSNTQRIFATIFNKW